MEEYNTLKLESSLALDALYWIKDLLSRHQAVWRISGGLAARVYGTRRPLQDIDIDIDDSYFFSIFEEIKPYLVEGPGFYHQERWKFENLAILNYHGQPIELCGTRNGFYFSDLKQSWLRYKGDYTTSSWSSIGNQMFPVIDQKNLVDYKKHLNRLVDQEDVFVITSRGRHTL